MATTYRAALNRVLAIMGEAQIDDAVSELTTTYQKLLGGLMNDVKEQIEDAHNWRALRTTETLSTTAGTLSTAFTSATERTRLARQYDTRRQGYLSLVFDITDATEPDPLIEMDLKELIYRDEVDPDTRTTDHTHFAMDQTTEGGVALYHWPRTSGARSIKVYHYTPQGYLADTDLASNIDIPIRPLIVGTLWYALEERGEELGIRGLYNRERFEEALSSAIARDQAEAGDSFELSVG